MFYVVTVFRNGSTAKKEFSSREEGRDYLDITFRVHGVKFAELFDSFDDFCEGVFLISPQPRIVQGAGQ